MKVVVALSGGVDSAVAAYLLKQEGHDLVALFMKNWEEKEQTGLCTSARDFQDVVLICDSLQIPYYTVDFTKEYWERVFSRFLKELTLGNTPNPDVLCNKEIKFNLLYDKALEIGGEALATGHYCRHMGGMLFKGVDKKKDQSYFLFSIPSERLEKVRFPLGHYQKSNVKEIAKKAGLPVADKKESMGICFIGKRKFKPFLEKFLPNREGPIETLDGKVIGVHQGSYYYTIGQRKGLGIGGPGGPWFVVKKDPRRNAVIVAQGSRHVSLSSRSLIATSPSWVGPPPPFPLNLHAKIRYRQQEEPCWVTQPTEGTLLVHFDRPQRAVTPGQSIVFYEGERCLGGATIRLEEPSSSVSLGILEADF